MSWEKYLPHSRAKTVSGAFVLGALLSPIAFPGETTAQEVPSPLEQHFEDLKYRNVGPSRGGRVTALAGHPAHPYTFHMGATGGGVWKTEDYGTTWRPISENEQETNPNL